MEEKKETLEKMTFLDHLDELRKRIMYALIAVVIGACIAAFFWKPILDILMRPAGDIELHYLNVLEPFMAKVKLSIFSGVLVAFPIIIFQFLMFLAPALKTKEKKQIYPLVFFLVILFFSGVVFGYFYIMPVGTKWLIDQAGDKMVSILSISQYLSYAWLFLLGFGLSFETPIFIWVLSKLGIVTTKSLIRNWRYAIIIILIASAILTPDWSPVTMALFSAPMFVLYLFSILLIKVF
ncbi:MAG: twin-arginine translocase subunit TatC [Actinomycetia bacterium]|nr:twin-arginine translocase subunit TatC [Actinomycetes bacterium]